MGFPEDTGELCCAELANESELDPSAKARSEAASDEVKNVRLSKNPPGEKGPSQNETDGPAIRCGMCPLPWCLVLRSIGQHFHSAADANTKTAKHRMLLRQFRRSGENGAEREEHMGATDSQTLQRLRREESLAEQQGRQALNIAVILKNFPQYDAARQKADALLAKASALREQIVKIETV